MIYNPGKHLRRSVRLRGYDYSRAGAYFVTICIQKRECLFENIVNDEMVLNNPASDTDSLKLNTLGLHLTIIFITI